MLLISIYLILSYGTPQSLPAFQHPSHSLLKENGFTQVDYSKYHSRCLKGKKTSTSLTTFLAGKFKNFRFILQSGNALESDARRR